jgi:hypothetical protein
MPLFPSRIEPALKRSLAMLAVAAMDGNAGPVVKE